MADNAKQQAAGSFSKYIRSLRKQHGLSVRAVARQAGLNPGNVAGMENGRTVHCPRPDTIKGLAKALSVCQADLLARVGYDVQHPDLRSYLCEHYRDLPESAIEDACRYIEQLATEHTSKPEIIGDTEDKVSSKLN